MAMETPMCFGVFCDVQMFRFLDLILQHHNL